MGLVVGSMPPLDDDVRRAYLTRLGIGAEPPSVAAMRLLVQRHAERVPYETLWIHGGESWSIDPYESAVRIALHGRGGYCYHLNGALRLLLESLGYSVRGHVGGVHGPEGPSSSDTGNHLVLTVAMPPSDANPSGVWYVDVGLGDALHEPLPLLPGKHSQPPFELSLEHADEASQWHLTHDPRGGFTGMTWTMAEAHPADFERQHRWLSTSPESGFVRVPMVERRDAGGVDVVRGLVLSRIDGRGRTDEPVTERAAWFDLLADVFDLRFDAVGSDGRDRLWRTVVAAHQRWQDAPVVQTAGRVTCGS